MTDCKIDDWAAGWSDTSVIAAHRELHHYTTVTTLENMLMTGSLWATHFQHLNDTSEVHGIQRQLVEEWSKSFETILRTKRRIGRVDRAIISAGGIKSYASILSQSLFDVLADVTFGTASRPATETVSGSPFILSFCSHVGQTYEATHGLLSQWRGYPW